MQKKIAEALGKELVIVKYKFEALIPAVNAKSLDMIIAGMSPTAERKEAIDFSDAYYTSQLVIVVRKDGAFANATKLADFNGAKIAAPNRHFPQRRIASAGKEIRHFAANPDGYVPRTYQRS